MAAAAALLLLAFVAAADAHSYHFGSCPTIPPMQGFIMSKFRGKWYVQEKTATRVRCLTNVYLRPGEKEDDWERRVNDERDQVDTSIELMERLSKMVDRERDVLEWKLVQRMKLPVPAVNNGVTYNGQIKIENAEQPAAMRVTFPLNIMGSSSYIVFDTDYDTYAGVYSCQNIAFWHRQSASIMSRTESLDANIIKKLRKKLSSYGIDVGRLNRIRHTCHDGNQGGIQVNIKPDVYRFNLTNLAQDANDIAAGAIDTVQRGVEIYNTVNTFYAGAQNLRKRRDSTHEEMNSEAVEESTPRVLGKSEMDCNSKRDIDRKLELEESTSEILVTDEMNHESGTESGDLETLPTEGSIVTSGDEIVVFMEENNNTRKVQGESESQDKITEIRDSDDGEDLSSVSEDEAENERNLESDTEVNERTLTNFLADLTVDWMP